MITLYGAILSPYVRIIRMMLGEKGLDYAMTPVMPFADNPDETFLRISPLKKIPALTDGEVALADSKAISIYLERAYPQHPLYPESAAGFATTVWFQEYAGSALSDIAVKKIFFAKLVAPMLQGAPADEVQIRQAFEVGLPPILTYLTQALGANDYLVENAFSMGDLAVASPLISMEYAGYPLSEQDWPQLVAHLSRVKARPIIAQYLEEEKTALDKLKRAN